MKTLWRNNEYSEGCRDAVEVITFEMYDLGNVDVPATVYNKYILPNRKKLEKEGFSQAICQIEILIKDDEEFNFDRNQYVLDLEMKHFKNLANDIISMVNLVTGKNIKYVLWLADKEAVKEWYDGNEENMLEFETSSIILSDLGKQGYLFGYESVPVPVTICRDCIHRLECTILENKGYQQNCDHYEGSKIKEDKNKEDYYG